MSSSLSGYCFGRACGAVFGIRPSPSLEACNCLKFGMMEVGTAATALGGSCCCFCCCCQQPSRGAGQVSQQHRCRSCLVVCIRRAFAHSMANECQLLQQSRVVPGGLHVHVRCCLKWRDCRCLHADCSQQQEQSSSSSSGVLDVGCVSSTVCHSLAVLFAPDACRATPCWSVGALCEGIGALTQCRLHVSAAFGCSSWRC
jgi:hypothetical protein